MRIISLLMLSLLASISIAQAPYKAVPALIKGIQSSGQSFQEVTPFYESRNSFEESEDLKRIVEKATLLKLSPEVNANILRKQPDNITFTLPTFNRNSIQLELTKVHILSDQFRVKTDQTDNFPMSTEALGVHYRGVIKGNDQSLVAISFLGEEVMGMVSASAFGNMVLGKVGGGNSTNEHILYNDADLKEAPHYDCATPDDGYVYSREELMPQPAAQFRTEGDCVELYVEVDYDIFQNKGSEAAAVNYVVGAFNQVNTIYANEDISNLISGIFVWTSTSPYAGSGSFAFLNGFQNFRTQWNGDLAILLNLANVGGVAAGFNGLCNSNRRGSMSYAGINSSFNEFPFTSWTVDVITHEFGHLFGSRHTHACVWNGNGTAIDGCSSTEGSCPNPGYPEAGTIMSYCHLNGRPGKDFTLGFGSQPGNVIRNQVAVNNCMNACIPPVTCDDGIQNGDESGVDCGGSNCPACPVICDDNEVTLTLIFDAYASETSWKVKDEAGNILYESLPYKDDTSGEQYKEVFCLPDGCYDFIMEDSYRDGMCCFYGEGSYKVIGSDGRVLASGASFGEIETTRFCLGDGLEETCNDGILNGDEIGIDCGGSCTPCVSCNDGIQNGDETGVDCGGSCTPCTTCDDGIQNGDETGVDCGGACVPCVTCEDGIQNGDEEGVDCGGSFCLPCVDTGEGCFNNSNDFESGFGIWIDGGSDCDLIEDEDFAASGSYTIRLRDDSESSYATTPNLDLSDATELVVSFSYMTFSLDNGEEDFWLQVSTDGGFNFTTVEEWNLGDEFENNERYNETLRIPGPFNSSTQIRFRCDASSNTDYVYLDDIHLIAVCGDVSMPFASEDNSPFGKQYNSDPTRIINLFPNPTSDRLIVSYQLAYQNSQNEKFNTSLDDVQLVLTDFTGKEIQSFVIENSGGKHQFEFDVSRISSGFYFIHIVTRDERVSKKFVVAK